MADGMVDGKAIVLQFLDVAQKLIKNMTDVMPHLPWLCTFCDLVARISCCPMILLHLTIYGPIMEQTC